MVPAYLWVLIRMPASQGSRWLHSSQRESLLSHFCTQDCKAHTINSKGKGTQINTRCQSLHLCDKVSHQGRILAVLSSSFVIHQMATRCNSAEARPRPGNGNTEANLTLDNSRNPCTLNQPRLNSFETLMNQKTELPSGILVICATTHAGT